MLHSCAPSGHAPASPRPQCASSQGSCTMCAQAKLKARQSRQCRQLVYNMLGVRAHRPDIRPYLVSTLTHLREQCQSCCAMPAQSALLHSPHSARLGDLNSPHSQRNAAGCQSRQAQACRHNVRVPEEVVCEPPMLVLRFHASRINVVREHYSCRDTQSAKLCLLKSDCSVDYATNLQK